MRLGLLVGVLLFPATALAVDFFGPIVPPCTEYGLGSGICQACNLAQLASRLMRAFVAFAVIGSVLMLAYAGFLYVSASTNSGNIQSAKSVFSNVFIGLIIVLVAWLIIDIALRTFTNQSLNVLTTFQCVQVKFVGGKFTFPQTPQNDDDAPSMSPNAPTKEGEGLDNVDSNTNYNPVACKQIANYLESGVDRKGRPASCTDAAKKASSDVRTECIQGCMGSANGKRIITVADYKYCKNNPGGTLNRIEQAHDWTDYPTMSCSQALANGVTIATPQGSGIPRGQRFTWPELAKRYGLPEDTVFTADDSYGYWCDEKQTKRCGYTTRGTYSIDVARCITNFTGCNNLPTYGGTVPMKTKPTPVPGG